MDPAEPDRALAWLHTMLRAVNGSRPTHEFRQHRVRAAIGDEAGVDHMHNTRGLGLANCLAACDEAARLPLQEGRPGEPLCGMTPLAGLPRGWSMHEGGRIDV